jgi:hypothetical protein
MGTTWQDGVPSPKSRRGDFDAEHTLEVSMTRRWKGTAATLLALAACQPAADETDQRQAQGNTTTDVASASFTCTPSDRMPVEGRASPYDSTAFRIGGHEAKLCYGRPSVRGRTIFGDLVPYDTLWRTGANEPTIIHLPVAATIAGIAVEPGSYSLYTVPGRTEWQVVVNRSTSQWGHESQYVDEVRQREVGRASVAATRTAAPVETFTIHAEPAESGADLVLEWENTRASVPVRPS